jgi:hypothetical protein
MTDTFILFKDWNGYYFLTNEKNYNARIMNARTLIQLNTKEKNDAIEIFENNFKDCKLIVQE